ncbi:MAG: hypothetical protein WD607_05820 [Candidatus Paceibacterota bacterium]
MNFEHIILEEEQKEGEPLTWVDARLVVFQTVNVMVELDRTLGN